jgi:hypothetical protein
MPVAPRSIGILTINSRDPLRERFSHSRSPKADLRVAAKLLFDSFAMIRAIRGKNDFYRPVESTAGSQVHR